MCPHGARHAAHMASSNLHSILINITLPNLEERKQVERVSVSQGFRQLQSLDPESSAPCPAPSSCEQLWINYFV